MSRRSQPGVRSCRESPLLRINAATQRALTPFRIRQLTAVLKPGARIDRDKLTAMLSANGYVRTDTVADAGEFAVRGSLVDLFPAGEEHGLRAAFKRCKKLFRR